MIQAINLALIVISWFENLPKDEAPPRYIWWSEDLIDEWFEEVRERRKEDGGASRRPRSSYKDATDVPMTQNEYAAQFRPKGRP